MRIIMISWSLKVDPYIYIYCDLRYHVEDFCQGTCEWHSPHKISWDHEPKPVASRTCSPWTGETFSGSLLSGTGSTVWFEGRTSETKQQPHVPFNCFNIKHKWFQDRLVGPENTWSSQVCPFCLSSCFRLSSLRHPIQQSQFQGSKLDLSRPVWTRDCWFTIMGIVLDQLYSTMIALVDFAWLNVSKCCQAFIRLVCSSS